MSFRGNGGKQGEFQQFIIGQSRGAPLEEPRAQPFAMTRIGMGRDAGGEEKRLPVGKVRPVSYRVVCPSLLARE